MPLAMATVATWTRSAGLYVATIASDRHPRGQLRLSGVESPDTSGLVTLVTVTSPWLDLDTSTLPSARQVGCVVRGLRRAPGGRAD